MMPRALLIALLTVCSPPLLAATEIIPLHYRLAEEMLPVAQSILGSDGRASAYSNQLVVNAPAGKISELRQVINKLDTPPRRLLISVATSNAATAGQRNFSVDGTLRAGGVEVSSSRGSTHSQNSVRIQHRTTRDLNGDIQQVQATEGYPALIQVGQSVPLETASGFAAYGRVYREREYRDVSRGFYITAQVSGDQVQITLSSKRDRLNPTTPDVIDTQSLNTHVSGRLGEWIDIGNSAEGGKVDESDLLRQSADTLQRESSIRLKVELAD